MNKVSFRAESGLGQKISPCRVVVIAGFLGSGKTTLLRNLLDWEISHGNRPKVIMSEFGDLDVDGLLVSNDQIELIPITGGCACCDLREELAKVLLDVVHKEPGATIFIESTGVGDPAGIILAIESIIRNGLAIIGNVIVVYDASRHLLFGKDSELVKDQLIPADTILINKSDLVAPSKIKDIIASIKEVNKTAELIVTSQGKIEPEIIKDKISKIKIAKAAGSTSKSFRSFGFQIETPLDKKALEKWLKSLPPSVVRVKGFVKLDGQDVFFEVQAVCGRASITSFDNTVNPPPILVLIAHPMRTNGVVRRLKNCLILAK